jgi:hypothetical protein
MSILRWKKLSMPQSGPMGGGGKGGGGGGGGPQQVTSTTTQSNIPEYARPYVENMLQSAQSQIYNDSGTGFRPYQPYSSDVNNYFAPFSPLQQSAQQATWNLQTPEQIGAGSDLTAVGGVGALGTAGQMANAGQNYQNQATSMYGPGSVGAYMNPYLAQSLAPQLQQLNQQFGIKGAQEQGAATSAGAFGGSRNALMQGLNQQNQQLAAQQAIAQGYNQAYQQAQQAQQFGANLGLQGQQGALQGYGQAINAGQGLGQLGSQQLAAQQGIINAQSTMGAQQQSLEQNKINQAIQDYGTAQQYPFMQLGMLNSMLRGLPMQNMSTQQYQATPSYLTQGLGAVGTLAGAYKAFGQKEGGIVQGMKAGGKVPKYAGPEGSVVDSMRAKLEQVANMPNGMAQLQKIKASSPSKEVRKLAAEVIAEHQMEMQADKSVTPPQAQAQNEGIAALPAPSMDGLAGGGIVAFAGPDGSQVEEDPDLKYLDLAEKQQKAALERAGITGAPNAKYKEFIDKQIAGLGGEKDTQKGLMMMDYFSNLGTQTGPLGYAALKAARETTPSFRSGLQSIKKAEADVMKSQADLQQADRLEALGLNKEANDLRKNAEANEKALEVAKINAAAHIKAAGMSTGRPSDADKRIETIRQAIIAKLPEEQRAAALKDPTITAQAQSQYFQESGLTGAKLDAKTTTDINKIIDERLGTLKLQIDATKDPIKKAELENKYNIEVGKIYRDFNKPPPAATPGENAPPKAPDISTIKGAPEGSSIGNYVQGKGYEIKDKGGKLVGYAQP